MIEALQVRMPGPKVFFPTLPTLARTTYELYFAAFPHAAVTTLTAAPTA